MRFDKNLERGFNGRINEDGALAEGELQLVSLNRLIREARRSKARIDAAGNLIDLEYKAACEAATEEIYLDNVLEALAHRNTRAVNKRMGRTYASGTLLKRVAQLRFSPPRENAAFKV